MSATASIRLPLKAENPDLRDWLLLVVASLGRLLLSLIASLVIWAMVPVLFGLTTTTVASGSMEPRINIGDVVSAMPVDSSSLREKQVILFEDPAVPGRLRLHRILSISDKGIQTKGDNNPSPDSMLVSPDAVVGVGFIRVPSIGVPINWGHEGKILELALFLATLVLAAVVSNLDRDLRRRDREGRRLEALELEAETELVPDLNGDAPRAAQPNLFKRSLSQLASSRALSRFSRRSRLRSIGLIVLVTLILTGTAAYILGGAFSNAAFSSSTASAASLQAAASFGRPWDQATFHWAYSESSPSTTATDDAGSTLENGTLAGGVTRATADGNPYVTFDGTSGKIYSAQIPGAAPTNFALETWFSTTTTRGGKLMGYGNSQTGSSSSYDRHIYMTNSGQLVFGVYNGGYQTLISPKSYNDGKFHMVTATLSSTAGSVLYVDGVAVASSTTMTKAEAVSNGYWRVGYDNISGWPSAPTSNYYAGSLDDTSLYPTGLTATQVADHFAYGR